MTEASIPPGRPSVPPSRPSQPPREPMKAEQAPKAPPEKARRWGTRAFWVAVQHLATHRAQAVLLALAWGLAAFLPLASWWTDHRHQAALKARAEQTPLVLGAAGGRYDLVLNTLYFQAPAIASFPQQELDGAAATELAKLVPLHSRYAVRGHPVVGTNVEAYAARRGLSLAQGRLPAEGLEAVLGAQAAAAQGLKVGDRFLPDAGATAERAAPRPQLMTVVGVFAPAHPVDDAAVFVRLAASWSLAGLEGQLTGALVYPQDDAAATRLKALTHARPGVRMISPAQVVEELLVAGPTLGQPPAVRAWVLGIVSALLLGLAGVAQLALRREARAVLVKLGASRLFVACALGFEALLLAGAGLLLAALGLGLLASGG